ncbi:Hypothetical protein HEAR2368 [Herminiimonas arsenicoxydans]|uniref:Uncharacterized protein n=1 Tax=Herminiimonas arsenicoxydans TaxID=204773 RepID=A4G7L2_HERAR|nr:Hypothetical protein HEAR2368 [Herminiimonas arsenicoxydans]
MKKIIEDPSWNPSIDATHITVELMHQALATASAPSLHACAGKLEGVRDAREDESNGFICCR